MKIEFTKMHGLGNDFIVINGMEKVIDLSEETIRSLSDRHFGIGCDQILLLENSIDSSMDLRYRIFNADGSEVEHCGNGIRCVGKYLTEKGINKKNIINAETMNGNVSIMIDSSNQITVDMGLPVFDPVNIPLATTEKLDFYEAELSTGLIKFMALSMGNPHAVIQVEDLDMYPVKQVAKELQIHPLFPNSVNVGFMEIYDKGSIGLRVYERGVGETLACGTGACAAMVAGRLFAGLDNRVDIALKGGHLKISWGGINEHVMMQGPATTVYEGQIDI
jgi:diaminopimelate epimerase